MKSYTKGYIKLAITALRANRWRSFLTMLGVIIGVASVISVVSVSQGVKRQVNSEVNKLGKDLITVRAAPVGGGSSLSGLGLLSEFNVAGSLATKDYGSIATAPYVATSAPLAIVDGEVRGDTVSDNTVVIGTSPDLPTVLGQSLAYGLFFTPDESDANVAVLGQNAARNIFDENVPLGRNFSFRGQQFVVRGIFDAFDTSPLSGDADFNNAIFIPYNLAQKLTGQSAPLYEVFAKPISTAQLDNAVSAIRIRVAKNHGGQKDFTVTKSTQTLAVTNSILDLLTRLIGGVAAISLLVGGVGIMNVMLVSVTERMSEIGIRKAVGATNRQILGQFMIEATVLSFVGGILGVVAAGIIDILLIILTDLHPFITWQVVLVATGVSLLVGVIFGSVPAFKAARKQPISALRNE